MATLHARALIGSITVLIVALLAPTASAKPPANDDCSNAQAITDGTWAFTTVAASTDGTATAECFDRSEMDVLNDVWFVYAAPCSGTMTATTCGTAGFDTRVAIYLGPCGSGDPIGCADDTPGCPGGSTRISTLAIAGTSYFIRVGGHSGATGVGALTVECQPTFPPEGPAYRTKVFAISGSASGNPLSWCVHLVTPPAPGAAVDESSFCNHNVPAVPLGSPIVDVATALITSINDYPLLDTQLFASALGPVGVGTSYAFRIDVGGPAGTPTDFEMCFGSNGQLPCCPVPQSPATCTFNPQITEIPLSGRDCNGNGEDDAVDILMGVSADGNGDGVPDECCPADWNISGEVNSDDFFAFLDDFFDGDADYDISGTTDSTDFFRFLTDFFEGC